MNLPDFVPKKLLFRPSEVADLFGISQRTIERDMESGAFGEEGVRQRGKYRWVTYQGILTYLQEGFPPVKI